MKKCKNCVKENDEKIPWLVIFQCIAIGMGLACIIWEIIQLSK